MPEVSGLVGLVDPTLGPGAPSRVTGLVEALNDGSPPVATAGDVQSDYADRNMTQETDQVSILRPAVKELIRVEAVHCIPSAMRRAFAVATPGRPRPGVVDLPEDIAHRLHGFYEEDFARDPSTEAAPAPRCRPEAEALIDILPGPMSLVLIAGLFSNLPVGIVLTSVTLVFDALPLMLGEIRIAQLTLLIDRNFGGIIENPVFVTAPMFISMGLVMERTRIAEDLLIPLQKLLRLVPGGLALAVTLMGTIRAPATGIIEKSVVKLTVLACPRCWIRATPFARRGHGRERRHARHPHPALRHDRLHGRPLDAEPRRALRRGRRPRNGLGGRLGRLPRRPVRVEPLERPSPRGAHGVVRESLGPLALPTSIIGGPATPTDFAGVGAFAALLRGAVRGRVNRAAFAGAMGGMVRTIAMLLVIFAGATAFGYVFRAEGGEHFIVETVRNLGLGDRALMATMMTMIFVMASSSTGSRSR